MINDANGDIKDEENIKRKQVVGVEFQDDIYALAISNMIIHLDGRTNIYPGDCFKESEKVKKAFSPTIGFLNPPYKDVATDIEELKYVLNNLDTLRPGSTCIALVPLSCVIEPTVTAHHLKRQILSKHTLEAVMSMPEQLFHDSKANPVTCALVITAHKPHTRGKKTWFGYWRDDGFDVVKNKGRIDKNNTWDGIRTKWVNTYKNREIIEGFSLTKEVQSEDEWCAEAYMETKYSKIPIAGYGQAVKDYYKYLSNNANSVKTVDTRTAMIRKTVPLDELFTPVSGISSAHVKRYPMKLDETYVPYIRPSHRQDTSIDAFVQKENIDSKYIFSKGTLYVSTDGQGSHSYAYVSAYEFVPNSNVTVLLPKRKMSLQEKLYYAHCVTQNRYRFSYGRKPKGDRLKSIMLPQQPPKIISEYDIK